MVKTGSTTTAQTSSSKDPLSPRPCFAHEARCVGRAEQFGQVGDRCRIRRGGIRSAGGDHLGVRRVEGWLDFAQDLEVVRMVVLVPRPEVLRTPRTGGRAVTGSNPVSPIERYLQISDLLRRRE